MPCFEHGTRRGWPAARSLCEMRNEPASGLKRQLLDEDMVQAVVQHRERVCEVTLSVVRKRAIHLGRRQPREMAAPLRREAPCDAPALARTKKPGTSTLGLADDFAPGEVRSREGSGVGVIFDGARHWHLRQRVRAFESGNREHLDEARENLIRRATKTRRMLDRGEGSGTRLGLAEIEAE